MNEATEGRNAGIAAVLSSNKSWAREARRLLPSVLSGKKRVTGEQVRVLLSEAGLPQPSHHNAWGGFLSGLAGTFLRNTGSVEHMTQPKSHARRTPVYEVVPQLG